MLRSVELFSGAGGLALGIARAGFEHLAVVELDKSAYNTMKENKGRGVSFMSNWPIYHDDVREFDYGLVKVEVDLLAGGVPCQPFSIGGKHKGHEDARNMFPEMARAIRILKPRAVIVENVRGLARPSFSKYFGYIELMLSYPELTRKRSEDWLAHLARLERYHTKGRKDGLCYDVVHQPLNAADYGLPQKRERLFMVAIRAAPRGRVVVSLADALCRDITVGAVSDGGILEPPWRKAAKAFACFVTQATGATAVSNASCAETMANGARRYLRPAHTQPHTNRGGTGTYPLHDPGRAILHRAHGKRPRPARKTLGWCTWSTRRREYACASEWGSPILHSSRKR